MSEELILDERSRAKLDGIVSEMTANNEADADIQFVVNDFKSKYGVKKKDDTQPLKNGAGNGILNISQSKSQSPLIKNSSTLPNFNIDIPQFNPLTEAQKIAGKNILGQGTPVSEVEKQQQIKSKKSAILKAVTGKDISYEEVESLSNPMNTNYAQILDIQKQKPVSENTTVQIPALKEQQRQQQTQQTEFINNREFKVNNKQKDIQILEETRPEILKDIADKASDLDDIRQSESYNTDRPISERFTKPQDDVPYKPFHNYLETGELTSVSPMELFETAEKESGREKQLQYSKDRGKDNILNEYGNEQTAISYKQGLLKQKYETAENNLKEKYGEDWQQNISDDDKDFSDLITAQNGLKENYELSKDLLKSDKYADVNKMIKQRADRQVQIDKDAKEDTWLKFTDEKNKLKNIVSNVGLGLVNDLASLPKFVSGLSGNDNFNWTDKVSDATQRFTDAQLAYYNTPTNLQRQNAQDYAEVGGYKVFVDSKGKVQGVRDKDDFIINDEKKKSEIIKKFENDKPKIKTDWIDGEQILNQSAKIIGDMLVMVAEGGGIGAGIKGAGKLSGATRLLSLAENAKLTTSLAVISQLQNELMNTAIDKGMSKTDAAKYAAVSGAGVAAISLINPMEAEFLKNIKNIKSVSGEQIASFVKGGSSIADISKNTIGAMVKNSIPEIAEEQLFEPVAQNIINDAYKSDLSQGQELENTDVLGKDNLSQSLLTATTTFLPSIVSSKNPNSNSVKMRILENPENWMIVMDKKKELGVIDDAVYSAEVGSMQKAKKKYDVLKGEVNQKDRSKLAGLIGDKVAIESKLSDAPELKPKYENQVKEIDTKISNLTNGISDRSKQEDVLADEVSLASNVNIQSQDFEQNPIVVEPIDKDVVVPAADLDEQQVNEIFENNIVKPTEEEQNPYELKIRKKTVDESQITPNELVNTGQEQDVSKGLSGEYQDDKGLQQELGEGQVSGTEIPTEKVEETVDEILSTKKAEITPQKTIEIDRNVDSEDKAIKDNRGKKPNGYYIDVANLQEDGTADRVWEKAENAMPVKEYPTLDIFSHKKNGKVIISENNTGKKLVEADTIKEAKEKLKELIYKNGGELAFKDKLEKQSAQNSENNTNLVEDKAENEYVNNKLTDQDNVEQEPSIKDIENKAESNDEAELNEVVKKSDELINEAVGISRIPLSELHTDESRFQARGKLNEQVVKDIAENFSDADQDPIHVWTDPKDGKTYVLSGHHRYYGAKQAGRTDVKIIDRTKDFTEQQAIKFATEDANANRSMETPLERANTLRKKREKGDSKEEINEFLAKEGKNKNYVDNLSHLNPKGKTIETLESVQDSGNKVTQKETEKIADWIGEAKRTINGITNAHENELFDFLIDEKASERIKTKADFLQKVRSVVNPLIPEQPLNMFRFKNKTQGEQSYDEEVSNKKAEISERQKQIDAINDRFSNPANPDYIRTTSVDYETARKIADEKISKLDAERKQLQKQLEDIYRNKGKYVSAPTTGDLFGSDLVGDALDRIADKLGGKKNLTEEEKTSVLKDITDLALGLIQMGKATIDNVVDKIKEELKKRFPELDEKTVEELAENIEQKVIFNEAVKWYKDKGLSYEQVKERLDKIDADYTEQDLKDAFEEKEKTGDKKKRLQNRAFDGTEDKELKDIIESYGLTYETESQIIAEKEANDIIELTGLDNAFKAVQNGYIKGAQAAVIYSKMVDDVEAKLQKGDLSTEQQSKLKEIKAFLIDLFDAEVRDAGRFIAMLKRVYHKSLFTYDTMVKSATKAKGEPLTEEERLQIKEQSEKIAEFEEKIKELELQLEQERAENAILNIKAQNNKNNKSATFRAKSRAIADKVRKLKTKGLVLKDADGNPIDLTQNNIVSYNDIIEMVARTIEKTGEIIDGINTALAEIKKQQWYQKLSQRDKDAVDKQLKQDILDLDDDVSDDKFRIPHSLIREIVRNGTEDIDGIVKKVMEVYEDVFTDLDDRKVRDIITKYGEHVINSPDDIDKKISHAKRIGRLLSGKEDLLDGKAPKRSGWKREKPTPDERLLMQEIQQLLKNLPKSQQEIDNLWATALDKARTRVKNRIEELQLAIDKEEKIKRTKNVQNYNDTELDELKDKLKEKQAEYDEKFPKEKTELSDEQRLNQIINSKKKRLENLQEQKVSKVFERTKKDGVDKSKFPELEKQIADIDAEINEVTNEIRQDETWTKHIEKKRIELAKKSNQRRIEELQRRIRENDFIIKKNPTPINDDLKRIRKEKQKIADDYEHAKHKFELANRSSVEKLLDGFFELLSLSKQLVATADLSAPLRQGATVMLSNPMIWGKAFKDMHTQAFSDKFYKESIGNIKSSDNFDLAQDSGLDITDVDSINERKREEQFVGKIIDSDIVKKIPVLSQYRHVVKGSERAYSGFLNNIRFNLFEQGVKELEQAGYKFEDNPKMFKALATTINNLTGRGISPTGKTGKALNFILFSPKMLTSRFMLLYDLTRTDIPINSPSRKMAFKSLMGTIAWIGAFNVLGTIASNTFGDDDDDLLDGLNKKAIATDFAKVRDKQTTFDPTAGYAPLIRTLARFISEKSINSSGKERDLSKGYGQSRFSPLMEFMGNKLSPIVSYGTSVLTHKNPANKFEDSDKATKGDYITPLFVPLQVSQAIENSKDKDSTGKDFVEFMLALYGIGVQQYDNSNKKKK